MKSFVLAFAVLTAPLSTIAAQPADQEVVPASENAALRYWEAMWGLAPHDLDTKRQSFEFGDLTIDEWNAELVRAQDEIHATIEASKVRRCDFGVPSDWSVGEYVPHLTAMRQAASALLWDAERLALSNDFDGVTRRVAGTLRIAEHLAQNVQQTDSSLIALAISSMAYRFIEEHQSEFNSRQRGDIARALDRFRDSDPFRYKDGFIGQGSASTRWWADLRDSKNLPNGHRDAVADAEAMFGIRASIEELNEAFRGYQRFCDGVANAWASETADELIARLVGEAEAGQFGLLAAKFYQSVDAHRRQDRIANAQLAALRAWANGETETLEPPEPDRR